MLRRQARVPVQNKNKKLRGLGKVITTSIGKIKTRRNHGERDRTRIADQTAPSDPVVEHRTLQRPPPSTKHADIHAALLPHAIKNHRREQRPALVVEHRHHRARIHRHSTNALQ